MQRAESILVIPVYLPEKKQMVKVEVQIRTIAMDFWANLEHQLRYKADISIPDSIRKKLKTSAADIYHIDTEIQKIFESIEEITRNEEMDNGHSGNIR